MVTSAVRLFGPEEMEQAVEHHRAVIEEDATNLESYQALFSVWRYLGELDRAWCVAGLLLAFDKGGKEETGLYHEQMPRGIASLEEPLDHTLWLQCVKSPREDKHFGQMCSLAYRTIGDSLELPSLKDLGLNPKQDRLDLAEPMLLCSTIQTASRTLALPLPEVYIDSRATGLSILPTMPPALRVGPDMLSGKTERELAFVVGKYLTYFHPWHLLAAFLDEERLAELLTPLAAFIEPEEVRMWHRSVELTAHRAGVVVANDIAMAGRLIKESPSALSKASRADKVQDFVRYAISEQYIVLRELVA